MLQLVTGKLGKGRVGVEKRTSGLQRERGGREGGG